MVSACPPSRWLIACAAWRISVRLSGWAVVSTEAAFHLGWVVVERPPSVAEVDTMLRRPLISYDVVPERAPLSDTKLADVVEIDVVTVIVLVVDVASLTALIVSPLTSDVCDAE